GHELSNLTVTCSLHHQAVHFGKLVIRGTAPDHLTFEFRRPRDRYNITDDDVFAPPIAGGSIHGAAPSIAGGSIDGAAPSIAGGSIDGAAPSIAGGSIDGAAPSIAGGSIGGAGRASAGG